MTDIPPSIPESPKWAATTKMVVGLAIIALLAALVVYFRNIIGPLLLAFVLAFLIHPLAARTSRLIHVSWRMAVNLIYFVLIIILLTGFTLSGLAILQQAQSLVTSIDKFIQTLPVLVRDLSARSFEFGPFSLNFSQFDLLALTNQLLSVVQPAVGQIGTLLGKFATSAATSLWWGVFILLVSYFLLSESGQFRANLVHIEVPGYHSDVQTLLQKLATVWDAFLRGQLVISLMVIATYYIMLTLLGARLALVIAILAGLARFVPYFGPFVTWTITAIVTFLQASNYFGLEPLNYAMLVIALCILLDQIFDNFIVPRFMGQTLGLHPAGVLVAAIVATRLIGFVGLVLAAPVLATIVLVGRYVGRKMFDLDPWPAEQVIISETPPPWLRLRNQLIALRGMLKARK